MVLKFKVWKIGQQRFGSKTYVTYRDKEGKLRRVAKTPEEEYELMHDYEKYNREHTLQQLLAVKRLKEHVRRIKANVRKRGFTKQLSIYGITKNTENGKRVYRRYEIFKASAWQQAEVAAIHDFFKKSPPKSHAGIFIYHNDHLLVVGSDKITQKGTSQLGYDGERRNPVTD